MYIDAEKNSSTGRRTWGIGMWMGLVVVLGYLFFASSGEGHSLIAPSTKRRHTQYLTKKESCLVPLLCQGLTNREIAEHLHLSPLTIRNYISKLLLKFEAHNRTELLVKIIKLRRRCHKPMLPEP